MSSTSRRPDRKAQLAGLAAELFRARGYHGVGINDIAAAAGITGPAVYRHFADKQAILAYVLLDGVREMEDATAAALSTLRRPDGAQVERLLRGIAESSVERRDVAALWRWEGRHLSPEDQREIGRRSAALLTSWAKELMNLRPDLGPADAELLCWAAMSVFGSVSVHRTSVARKRFAELLASLARRVLHVRLPDDVAEPAPAPAGVGVVSRREQILSAAAELFQRRGFHAVSMEDIGAAAGIAGPSVYRHFSSKAALLGAIARRAADRLLLDAERVRLSSADETEALRGLIDSYVRVLTGSAELAVSFSADAVNYAEEEGAELLRIQRDYVAQWVSLLGAAQPSLNPREAKITVHAALTIANDLSRTRRVNSRPGLAAELRVLMAAVLDLG
ncbi:MULTISPECIES: TetR/AcrR family transcriptional regulator [Amycolatopsis]|uniref:TetR/AcrR family transcriptional regulator n=1 Tax=Amycolatopsis thermalba TaxID=944492 RepID=A0ABY4P3T5_9PSEU|nr:MULTISPECIES: TetR/AcrR family transcriptional regulator [Amycolatopsis]OXM63249.1 TetR family transcriptional regulator [Amycolatopsis sp. KNN50.9b]UQS27007.1 TetR/AcrR family transcriptional regulator [Amycolatopsis thermalba]